MEFQTFAAQRVKIVLMKNPLSLFSMIWNNKYSHLYLYSKNIGPMKYILIAACLLLLQSCKNSNVSNNVNVTTNEQSELLVRLEIPLDSINGAYLRLDKNRHDFGKVSRKKTPDIPMEFEIENLGKIPLLILKADVSCGCLSVDYPKAPIHPGEKAKLTVNVDTKAQEGVFNKTVFLKSNADNDVELIRILGEVKK